MVMRLRTALLLGALCSSTTYADTLKRVLILDVVNYEQDTNYDYLQGSITDALTNKLKEKFVFRETPKEEWQIAAKSTDLVFLDESYTRTFAMSLGINMRQDIAISGGFRKTIFQNKPVIKATLFLLDIRNRRIVATIEKNMPPTGDLFSSVDNLADDLAKAAAQVLPGKELVEQNQAAFSAGDRSLTITSRVTPLAIIGLTKFDETNQLPRPSQLTMSYEAGARYEMQRFWKFIGVWGQAQGFFCSTSMTSAQRASKVPVTAYGGSLVAGASMSYDLRSRMHLVPRLGLGYFFGVARQDFSSYERPALDINSNTLTTVNSLFYGSIVLLGGEFAFDLSSNNFIEAGIMTQFFINGVGLSTTVGATLGFGWRY